MYLQNCNWIKPQDSQPMHYLLMLVLKGQRECGNLKIFMFLQISLFLMDMLYTPSIINCLHLVSTYCILHTYLSYFDTYNNIMKYIQFYHPNLQFRKLRLRMAKYNFAQVEL